MTPKQFEKWFHRPAKITLDDGHVLEGIPVPNDWKKYCSSKMAKIILVPFEAYAKPETWYFSCQWFFCAKSVKKVEEAKFEDVSLGETETDLQWDR